MSIFVNENNYFVSVKRSLIKYALCFLLLMLIFMLQKPLFMLFNVETYGEYGWSAYWQAMSHGKPLDASLAGYLSVVPGLMLIAAQWVKGRWFAIAQKVYFGVVSVLLSAIFVIDTVLYSFWESKLDTTPFFYFMTSPDAAFASVSGWYVACGVGAMLLLAAIYYALFYFGVIRMRIDYASRLSVRWIRTIVLALLTGLLFIPIRGGFTVATMNLSAVYFSADQRLNHAAVNPAFSLMYSATHQSDFSRQFRYFDDDEAAGRFSRLMAVDSASTDTVEPLLTMQRPDIYMIILESFSTHLMPSMGGEKIAVGLDSIARSGLLWTNFYASSYRTDRAIPAILSGYPGQPSTSIMKYVKKAESLPSIPRTLKAEGYDCTYYYGGDANFTNMKAYLVSAGFETIIEDKDFPLGDRLSKWGVLDHKVFERAAADNADTPADGHNPRLVVVQTSSSHEPFDVPYCDPTLDDPAANAFAYTDSCLTAFVNRLRESPRWDRSLIIMVPDHYGAYPRNLSSMLDRHHIPLVMTGGALARKGEIAIPSSQVDIAATLFGQMGIAHSDFKFSKDIFAPGTKRFAIFTEPSLIGLVAPADTLVYGLDDGRIVEVAGAGGEAAVGDAQAFLQTLYDDLDRR